MLMKVLLSASCLFARYHHLASSESLPACPVWDGKIQAGMLPFLSGQPCLVQVSMMAGKAFSPAKRVT